METLTKTKKSPYEIVDIIAGDREIAVSYMPEMAGIAAVVDLKTLQRITGGFRQFRFDDIKAAFCDILLEAKDIEEYMTLLQDELAFHQTCNRILITNFEEAKSAVLKAEEALIDSRKPLSEKEMEELKDLS